MRKLLPVILVVVIFAFAGSASAYTVSVSTDVGGLDSYSAKTNLSNNGENAERSWVAGVLGDSSVTFVDKLEDISDASWKVAFENTNVYALSLGSFPLYYDYFLVKLGNNNTGFTDYLFQNNAELSWAVLDLTTGLAIGNDIDNISHISLFNVDSTPVPEPSTLLMLGAGLLGLGMYGRRRVQK